MGLKNEACDDCKRNCLLVHGNRVTSFFKIMIGNSFSKILYFPPKFARSVSHLTDQETYLEDTSGRQWSVTVRNQNGTLAIRTGWSKFSAEHDLNEGDFLVFHYVHGQHFIVQIFGVSGCEKNKFNGDINKGKKRSRTYLDATSQDELLRKPDISSVNRKNKTSAVLESEKVAQKPRVTNLAMNVGTDTKRRQLVPFVSVDESFCMIDRDAQYDHRDDRCLNLSSFEIPARKPLAEGSSNLLKGDKGNFNHVKTNLKSQREPSRVDVEVDYLNSEELLPKFKSGTVQDIPVLGQKDKNDRPTGVISSSFLKSAENNTKDGVSSVTKFKNPRLSTFDAIKVGNHKVLKSSNKDGRCMGNTQITKEKSKEASRFARETIQVKEEFEETAAYYPARAISGEDPANGNATVIKSEPVDFGDAPSLNASVGYSCLVEVNGRDFLELPEPWYKHLTKKTKLGAWIIFLRGPDKRIWPILYQRRFGADVLTWGWKFFAAVYGLNRRDNCVFKLKNKQECIFDALKI